MTARKLPSGNYNVQIYDYTDHAGKQHYKSFTASTRREAERLAIEYQNRSRNHIADPTVSEALDGYITTKAPVLSPSTIRGYRQLQNRYYERLNHKHIHALTTMELQHFVSDLSNEVSAKTVSNVYGLLSSAMRFYDKSIDTTVTLPKKQKRRPVSPSDEQVQQLFQRAEKWLQVSIALAAFGSLRRGEICAVRFGDIRGVTIHVHADRVKNPEGEWVIKETPKTSESDRMVNVPPDVIRLIGQGEPGELIVKQCPDSITKRFIDLRDDLGLSIRFHDLRHYFASIGVALGIPDIYLADMGGWAQGSTAMKQVYQNKIVHLSEKYADKMSGHFQKLIKEAKP